jgi:DHA1 family quinolone resistance protein-like MFS transporter
MNKTLKLLIISDMFILGGFGLISPILAVFIKDNLVGGTLFTAGLASTIFLITHAILQMVFANVFNPKDRRWMLLLGTGLIVSVPFIYTFSTHILHIFLAQFIYGIGAGFAYPAWYSLFTSNVEKKSSGFQWSLNNSAISICTAITAAGGAWLAEKIGFQWVFLVTGAIAVTGLLILFHLDKKVNKRI